MKNRKLFALLLLALLLCLLGGCMGYQQQIPLWQLLEQQQYNRYKPRLDYMVKKYGPLFEMDVYGSLSCTQPDYQGWHIRLGSSSSSFTDNFAPRLLRDQLEQQMQQLAQPIFRQYQVYLVDSRPCSLDGEAEPVQFFTQSTGLLRFCLCLPETPDCQAQGQALLEALEQRQYKLNRLTLLFFGQTQYGQIDRQLASSQPEGYQFCMEAEYNETTGHYDSNWKQNYALDALTEKYGPLFQMEAGGAIRCTGFEDWPLAFSDRTSLPIEDNFAPRLLRDQLEAYLQQLAQPVFGQCKVYLTQASSSSLGPEAQPEDFFTQQQGLVGFRVCVPYSEKYKVQGEGLLLALLERRYKLTELKVEFWDSPAYQQIDRDWNPQSDCCRRMNAGFDRNTGKVAPMWSPAP